MKTKFYKVFSLVLVMTLLVCSGIAAVASNTTPVSNLASIALQGANTVVDGTADKEVTIQLVVQQDLTCYNIEGTWTTETGSNDAITLESITSQVLDLTAAGNYVNVTNGRVMWVDDSFMAESSAVGTVLLTATYAVSKDTPAGDYTITFTNRSFTDQTGYPNTEKLALTATIHVCRPSEATGKDATCKEPGYKGHYYCSSCSKLFADAAMTQQIENLEAWRNDENGGKIPTTNEHTMAQDINNPWTNNGDTHSANMVCKICRNYTELGEPVEHDFTDGDCVCGAEKPVSDIRVNAEKAKGVNFTVSANVVTVTHTSACMVGYWDANTGKYIAITAVANGDGSYSFTAPEGVDEVLLVVKGDVNGDGRFNVQDRLRLAKALLGRNNPNREEITEAWQIFAADVTGEGKVNVQDRLRLAKALLGKNNVNREEFTW